MSNNIDTKVLTKIIAVLYDWSGVSDDTPDDTEIVRGNAEVVTLGDLRDASSTLDSINYLLSQKKSS